MILAIKPETVKMELADPDGERDGMRVYGATNYNRFVSRSNPYEHVLANIIMPSSSSILILFSVHYS
eukprot:SAG31_NODE_55_length_29938_cov_9.154027_15_plen_67_part_00